MKCLTNKWREGAMLLSFLLISSLAGIFTAWSQEQSLSIITGENLSRCVVM